MSETSPADIEHSTRDAGSDDTAGPLPEPVDTEHPTGEKQATENAENEPAA